MNKIIFFTFCIVVAIHPNGQNLEIIGPSTIDGTLEVTDDLKIVNLSSFENSAIYVDANRTLKKIPRSIFSLSQNHNTINPELNNSAWVSIGSPMTFVKISDANLLDCQFRGMTQYYGATGTSASWLSLRVQVINATATFNSHGNIDKGTLWEFVSARSIYDNLPVGTYVIRIQAKTNNGPAKVFFA